MLLSICQQTFRKIRKLILTYETNENGEYFFNNENISISANFFSVFDQLMNVGRLPVARTRAHCCSKEKKKYPDETLGGTTRLH